MPTYISMVRGINVGGHNKVPMKELKECYGSLGFGNVRTYIQSGNVVFESNAANASGVRDRIQKGIKKDFGLDVIVIVRTREEVSNVIRNFPFKELEQTKMHVTFLADRPAKVPTKEMDEARDSAEKYSFAGREVYLFCPNGYGKTKLSNQFIEKKTGVYATTRNWRTVNTLSDLAND